MNSFIYIFIQILPSLKIKKSWFCGSVSQKTQKSYKNIYLLFPVKKMLDGEIQIRNG